MWALCVPFKRALDATPSFLKTLGAPNPHAYSQLRCVSARFLSWKAFRNAPFERNYCSAIKFEVKASVIPFPLSLVKILRGRSAFSPWNFLYIQYQIYRRWKDICISTFKLYHWKNQPEPMSFTYRWVTAYCIVLVGNPHQKNDVKCRRSVIEHLWHYRFHPSNANLFPLIQAYLNLSWSSLKHSNSIPQYQYDTGHYPVIQRH